MLQLSPRTPFKRLQSLGSDATSLHDSPLKGSRLPFEPVKNIIKVGPEQLSSRTVSDMTHTLWNFNMPKGS